MTDFLRLTTQFLKQPKPDEGVSFGAQNVQNEPVSIYDTEAKTKSVKDVNIIEKMDTINNPIFEGNTDNLDESIKEGNSVIEAAVRKLEMKSFEFDSLNLKLTSLTEKMALSGEKLAQTVNELANLMASEDGVSDDELERVTNNFIEMQKEFSEIKEDKQKTEEQFNKTKDEKTEAKDELNSYIDILSEEKQESIKDKSESPETAQDLQNTIDNLNQKALLSTLNSDRIEGEESSKRKNFNSLFDSIQSNYGVNINQDASVTQFYDDGSSRTFTIEYDENKDPYVTFEDTQYETEDSNVKDGDKISDDISGDEIALDEIEEYL